MDMTTDNRRAHTITATIKGLAWLFAACLLLQTLLAGLATFTNASYWPQHARFADYFAVLPLLMLIVSFTARVPKSLRIQSAALLGMIVLMFLTAIFSARIGLLSALHPVIALMLFFRTMALIAACRRTAERQNELERGVPIN
jgi:hypothetical protein